MAEPETMVSWSGTRHIAVDPPDSGWYALDKTLMVAECSMAIVLDPRVQHVRRRKADCKRCFPSPSDSLGAASTTLNPPPGEHTGGQQ